MDPHFRLLKAIKTGLLILLTAQMCLAGFPLVQSQDFAIPSDSSGVSWTDSILRGIREAFTRGGDHFSMVAESLDARRASDPGRANRIPEFLFVQHPESFYQKYRHFVWATLAVVLVLSASVVVLSIAIVRRRRAEEALQDSEQKFRTLFDDAKDAIFIHDLDGHILDMNREACVRLGYTRDEFLKMTPADVDIPEEAENVPARLGILRRQGYSLFETTHRQRDGSVYPVEVSSARFEHGGKTLVCSVCRDITERKRAEETLRQTNLVVENSPAMLFRWKAAEGWPVAFVSENVIQIGYSSEEFLNGSIPFASIIHPEDLERVGREVQTYSAKGVERFQQEYRIITKDGQIRWVDDRTVVERNAEGRITHYQGILVDITERKQAENLASARHRFSMRLASSTSLDEALSSCFDMILSISGMDSGGVYRVRSETSDLDLIFSKGLSESFVEAAKHLRVDSPQARIILAGNPVYSTYTALGVPLSSLRRKEGLRAIAIVPITYQGRVIACYNIASHTLDNIPEYVRELVEAVVLELGNAIARILAEESLRESEERLRTIGNNLPGVMIYQAVVKPDGSRRFSYVSVGVERLHGYTADQILADSSLFYSQVYEEDIERMLQQELLAIHELEPFDVEVRFRTRSGQVFWRRIVSQLRRLANGEVMSNGIELDITERKRAEEALRASETFLETIIEQSPHSMWVSDHRGTLLRMNQACRDLLHATDEELVGKYNVLEDNVVEEQGAMPLVKRVFEQGEQVRFTLRYDSARLQSPLLGETAQLLLEVTISPVLDAHRRVVHAIIQHLDITERERAQAALRESEERLRLALAATNLGLYDLNLQTGNAVVSPEYLRMIGYEPDEIEPTADWWREQLHPEDREASFRMLEKCVRAERTEYRLEYRMKAKSGHWRWLLSLGKVVGYDAQGQPLRMLGTHMDITERKQTEEELERAHTLLEAILDQSPVPMVVASAPDHVVRYGNRAAAELLGVSDEPSYAGLTLAEIQRRQTWHDLHPDGTPIGFLEMPLARAMRCETTRNEEYIVARKDGTQRWELVSGTPVYSSTGDLLAGLVVFPDITERKRAEEALRESEAFRKRVFESSQIPIIVMDAATFKYIDCNPAAVEIYRFASCEETLGKTPLDVSAPVQYDGTPSPEKVRFYIAKAQAEGTVVFEWRHQRPNGEVWDAEVHLMSFQSGPRKLFQFTLQEITERKRTEEELKSSEAILRSVFRATPVGITFNIDRVIIDVNDSMCELTGYREQELIGQDVRMCYVTQQEYEEAGREMYPKISQKGRVSVETRFRRKDGTIIYVFLTAAMLRVEDPSAGFVVTVQDITERKRAEAELTQHRDRLEELVRERTAELEKEIAERKQTEQRIQAALVEKELLLREVHHRVKNNLNTIANMLYFQTKTVEDKKALAAFQDSQHRIQSMARVHEHLYRAASLARVNMASYFEDLTVDLQQTCGTNTVSIRIDAAKEHLDIDQAIPCGLIVNELVTNSLKYAFPESPTNQRNEVTVQLTTQAEQHILEVRDNGVGLPAGMDVENSSSLGLRLVSMLTRQLKGRLTVDTAPGKGTRFTIAFPLEMKGIT